MSNVTAYKWVGSSDPVALLGQGGDCKIAGNGGLLCATTNAGALGGTTRPHISGHRRDPVGDRGTARRRATSSRHRTSSRAGSTSRGIRRRIPRSLVLQHLRRRHPFLPRRPRDALRLCPRHARRVQDVTETTAPNGLTNGTTTLADTFAVTDTATVTGHSGSGGTAPAPTGTVDFFLCSPYRSSRRRIPGSAAAATAPKCPRLPRNR